MYMKLFGEDNSVYIYQEWNGIIGVVIIFTEKLMYCEAFVISFSIFAQIVQSNVLFISGQYIFYISQDTIFRLFALISFQLCLHCLDLYQ